MSKFGHNVGYVDELYRSYLDDPESVSEVWREFFRDWSPQEAERGASRPPVPAAPPQAAAAAEPQVPLARPIVGAGARIVENMTASLDLPTATSVRTIPVKMLEENRGLLNRHQAMISGPRISFTHLIAWAILRALERHPRMNAAFTKLDGKPAVHTPDGVRLGLAIDLERRGERVLLVPNIANAQRLDFPSFVVAYDDLVERARRGALTVEDFDATSLTITNPGMLGTVLSVPRLMQGQGTIIGVGAIGYPAEYSGMAPEMISELGISKVMTVTSTYDHRVIQGAESGQFLLVLEQLLQGEHRFYDRIFTELGVPQEPFQWSGDRNPQILGGGNTEAIAKQAGVLQLIRAYRVRGHLWADLDPLGYSPEPNAELELSTYGLTLWDLDRQFIAGGLGGEPGTRKLREILETLQRTYCRHVGVEYMHIQDGELRHWLQECLEHPDHVAALDRATQIRILKALNRAEAFENFLHANYVGQKRFSLEGAETLLPMLEAVLERAAAAGVEEVVIGMAHRGRLNVLAHVLGKPYGAIFSEFEGGDPDSTLGSGDVKYHLGTVGTYEAQDGRTIDVVLASNPSHLEAVNPVVEGMARARQDRKPDPERRKVLPVLIHGDAAFAGQGVVAETLNLSQLSGYRTGGTIHIVVNNQIGFTTGPKDARSSQYPTDAAKMVRAPVLHVNGDHPEDAVRVTRLAFDFRERFGRDVVLDFFCYRRWGHNEADDPSYTQPILYSRIERQRSVRKLYTEQLLRRGDFDIETAEKALEDYRKRMREVHDEVRRARQTDDHAARATAPEPVQQFPVPADPTPVVDPAALAVVLDGLERTPDGFEPHAKLSRQLARRRKAFDEDRIDWGLAESLAFGTLVLEGVCVRLSGEDSARGTFSQRHAVLVDQQTAQPYTPLANLSARQAPFQVFDSLLSEFAVLGFEYGYSVDRPEALVLWEAQFGDFVNGAQVIIDQFIVCAEEKWNQRSSLTLLLPHGYEGQGPEHSSARVERFLQLAARNNLRIAHPGSPSQYFHLLRRQAHDPQRKPLVVLTPKSLLRLPACVSSREELTGGRFQTLIEDPRAEAGEVRRLLFCCGKIYYELDAARQEAQRTDVAICRLEQLYPLDGERIDAVLDRYSSASDMVWVQEEPRNMGAWPVLQEWLGERIGPRRRLSFVGRAANPSPATGSARRHAREQQRVVREALALEPLDPLDPSNA